MGILFKTLSTDYIFAPHRLVKNTFPALLNGFTFRTFTEVKNKLKTNKVQKGISIQHREYQSIEAGYTIFTFITTPAPSTCISTLSAVLMVLKVVLVPSDRYTMADESI